MQRFDNTAGKFCLGQQRVTLYLRGWHNGYQFDHAAAIDRSRWKFNIKYFVVISPQYKAYIIIRLLKSLSSKRIFGKRCRASFKFVENSCHQSGAIMRSLQSKLIILEIISLYSKKIISLHIKKKKTRISRELNFAQSCGGYGGLSRFGERVAAVQKGGREEEGVGRTAKTRDLDTDRPTDTHQRNQERKTEGSRKGERDGSDAGNKDRRRQNERRERQIGCRNATKGQRRGKKEAGIEKLGERKFISVCAQHVFESISLKPIPSLSLSLSLSITVSAFDARCGCKPEDVNVCYYRGLYNTFGIDSAMHFISSGEVHLNAVTWPRIAVSLFSSRCFLRDASVRMASRMLRALLKSSLN